LNPSQLEELSVFGPKTLTNWRKVPVGVSRASFELKKL
jgi:hypothetical protein